MSFEVRILCFDQDDPKKCTAKRLEKFGLLTPQKRELLIDKLTSIGFEPMDIEVVKALSILMLFQEPGIDVKFHTLEANSFLDQPLKLN